MFILISANDFIVFYLALELQSFCFYILASLKRYSNLSIEAALKYFILGSFSSGVFLFGISLLYAFYGTINFTEINQLIFFSDIYFNYFSVATFGLFFISVGLLFKLAIFPFHFWVADVYEGFPLIVTAFFAIVPKFVFLIALIKIYFFVFIKLYFTLNKFIVPLALASIIAGIFFSLYETKIKRLLAYSAITNMGYVLLIFSCFSPFSINVVLVYLFTYIMSSLNIFCILLFFRRQYSAAKIRNLTEFSIMLRANGILALIFSLVVLSQAGIPPLAGFFGKFFLFSLLMDSSDF